MKKFVIECPNCHSFAEAKTGIFSRKRIECACGNIIDIKADRMISKECPSCKNVVLYDQTKGKSAKCPVCHQKLVTDDSLSNTAHFLCVTCGCELQAQKSDNFIECPLCGANNNVQAQMKLHEKRKAGIPTTIQYEGDNKTFVWKYPVTDFVTGSQLIVHESQEAVFFRNGEALDSFPAGRYTLETGILPKMEKTMPLPVQGQPFHAEVYFINLTTQMNIKWGTNSKVRLFDPATGLHVELGASGSFNLQVAEPRKLLIKVVGTTNSLTQQQIIGSAQIQSVQVSMNDVRQSDGTIKQNVLVEQSVQGEVGFFRTLVMTKVKGTLARVIKEHNINVLEIDEHIDLISSALKGSINSDLTEYGLFMSEFYVSNIVTPDDDPNFKRMKEQHAEQYLKIRQEQIRKAEAEAAFERKAVEAQTIARMKVIEAQGEADKIRIEAQATAEAYRLKAEAEAQEMRMKGYTYQQETARQVGIEAMKNGGGGGVTGIAGDMMQLGVGLGTVGSVIGMTKEAITPVIQQAGSVGGWDCSCGQKSIVSNFCPNCGNKKPDSGSPTAEGWMCPECGKNIIFSNFCPNCGTKRPTPTVWNCTCGQVSISSKFCPNCGKQKGE